MAYAVGAGGGPGGYIERRRSQESFSRKSDILVWAVKKKQELDRRKPLAEETTPVISGTFKSCKECPVAGTKGEHTSVRVTTPER